MGRVICEELAFSDARAYVLETGSEIGRGTVKSRSFGEKITREKSIRWIDELIGSHECIMSLFCENTLWVRLRVHCSKSTLTEKEAKTWPDSMDCYGCFAFFGNFLSASPGLGAFRPTMPHTTKVKSTIYGTTHPTIWPYLLLSQ